MWEQLHTRVSKFMLAVFPSTVTLRLESSFTLTQSSPNMSLKVNRYNISGKCIYEYVEFYIFEEK